MFRLRFVSLLTPLTGIALKLKDKNFVYDKELEKRRNNNGKLQGKDRRHLAGRVKLRGYGDRYRFEDVADW
jgi:hypothetical protein